MRIYLGAAPGVGKTFAMLNEGWRRSERGTDVVVGYVETHGRPRTAEQVRDLQVIPRGQVEHRGTTFEEMDLDAVLARHPEVALVDELAHTNVPGSRNEKRWQDVEELLDAGHRRHLHREHPAPRVAQRRRRGDHRHPAAGDDPRRGRPRRRADRAGRLDPRGAAPADGPRQHLRARQGRRRARQLLPARQPGRPARAGAAVGGRPGRRVAPGLPGAPRHRRAVGDARARRRRRHRRARRRQPHPPGGAHREPVARASCSACTSEPTTGSPRPAAPALLEHRQLLEELGGTYHEVVGADVAKALVQAARAEGATQLVLGASRRSRWDELHPGVGHRRDHPRGRAERSTST